MLDISDEIKQLYNVDSTQKTLILEFYSNKSDSVPELTVSNLNIISESMVLNEALCDGETLEFGSIFASKFEIDIFNINTDLMGYYIKAYMTIANSVYKLPLFNGIVESSKLKNNRKQRHVVAYDDVYNVLDTDITDWYLSLANGQSTKPYYIKDFRKLLLNYLGLQYEEKNLVNDNFLMFIRTDKTGIRARDLLHDICEINGCFGRINRDNRFIFKEIKLLNYHYPSNSLYPTESLYPGVYIDSSSIYEINEYISVDYGEYKTNPITKIEIYDSSVSNDIILVGEFDNWYNYPTPSSNPILFPNNTVFPGYISNLNTYQITDNICVDPGEFTDLMAQQIFNAICNYVYVPINLKLRGLPYLEVGDVINVSLNDDNNTTITTIVLSRNLTGIQALKDEFIAKGDEFHNKQYKI